MNLVATHSNCTSPIDYISHHALHSHIPVHHYTNHTAVTIHSLVLIVSPHLHLIHPHTYKQHTYTHPLRSLVFPWLTFLSVLPIHPAISVFPPPDCLTLDLWTCACDPDFCLVLFSSLPCLWYSCFCLLTLPVWFCLLNIAASGSTRLWPFLTEDFAIQGSSNLPNHHFLGMDTRILFALKQGPRSLENHIREFLACAHYSDLPDIILIEIFCDGINQPLRTQLRREGPRSSLSSFFRFCFDGWLTIHCGCRGWGSRHCI